MVKWVESTLMATKTGVQSPVETNQRLKKWYLKPFCLILSVIRYGSRVSVAFLGMEWRPLVYFGVLAMEKGAFGLPSGVNFIYIYGSKQWK